MCDTHVLYDHLIPKILNQGKTIFKSTNKAELKLKLYNGHT